MWVAFVTLLFPLALVPANARTNTSACPNSNKRYRDKGDLGIRFNKFNMLDGSQLTLDWRDFPLPPKLLTTLQYKSDAYSPISPNDYEVRGACVEKYVEFLGGPPTMPSNNPNSSYWEDLRLLAQTQIDRRKGKLPPKSFFTLPRLWENFTVDDVAKAVHSEYPLTWQNMMIKSFLNEDAGWGIALDYNILPFRCVKDFIGLVIRLGELNMWSLGAVAPTNFLVKWHFGRPRGEVNISIVVASIISMFQSFTIFFIRKLLIRLPPMKSRKRMGQTQTLLV